MDRLRESTRIDLNDTGVPCCFPRKLAANLGLDVSGSNSAIRSEEGRIHIVFNYGIGLHLGVCMFKETDVNESAT